MSGHSKWHNIAAKKGKADAARGKIFTKLGRELMVAVKQGGPDPAGNSKLKDVIAKCKAANMPNDTINNAIKKASGAGNAENYEELVYEGYGPCGVAVIVNATTDNKNRTAADVRHVFDKDYYVILRPELVMREKYKINIESLPKKTKYIQNYEKGCQLCPTDYFRV